MGEAVASSEGSMDLEERERGTQTPENKDEDGSAASVVRWERFLPRMVLRVLLVEADDSTRQIISALLRKCSYKVAAVPDGLKAWEVLKGRPHSIDLILTEVELPSISGFALLTLVMEHEICKNIPVIMMSSNDSVNTAYRCMLRGAADFLLKPVRKNELRNLWQHVWRRQTSIAGGHQDESVAQKKVEATAENNAASNHSTGYVACIQRNRECIEKGSDAQSSCTKPDLEDKQDFSQQNCSNSPVIDMNIQKHEEPGKELLTQRNEAAGPVTATCKDADTMGPGEDMEPRSQKEHANIINAASDNNHASNFPREAIDLIGAFDSNLKSSDGSPDSTNVMNKSNSLPQLNLSLKRSHHSDSVNQFTDERHTLNHSDASAFSRYTKKAFQPLPLTSASVCNQQKENETTSDKQLSNDWHNFKPETHGALLSIQRNIHPFASSQPGHAEFALPCPQQRVFPVPVPVRGIRFESLCPAYGSEMPPLFCTQSGLSPLQSPSSAGHQGPSFQINQFHPSHPEIRKPHQFHDLNNQNINNSSIQPEQKQRHKLEMLEDRAHFSSATDQSSSSSFCNGAGSHLNSLGCRSNNNVNSVPFGRAAAECGNEECFCSNDGNFHQSIQREVALTKFRMKRKDRCYEKKVRYESRKKLAEQRPRVKGQFVRQLRTDPSPVESDNQCDNSIYG